MAGESSNSNMNKAGVSRRDFVTLAVGAICMAGMSSESFGEQKSSAAGMQYRTLGRTGEKVSIVGIGGSHIGDPSSDDEAIRIVKTALDNGINFLDNCWDYHNGNSEVRMGKALRDGYRQKAFLMSKIDGRDAKTAAQQIDESLKRLQTDHVDLMQFHEIIHPNDPERIFAKGGAYEAMVAAHKAGKVRYMGFTGHKSPDYHLRMLKTAFEHGWTPDTVQMPLNVMDAHFDSFEKKVLPELVKHNIGVLGMKSMGSNYIVRTKAVTAMECLHYAMNLPTSVVITGCDSMQILQQAIEAARSFNPMSKEQVASILAKTAELAKNGQYEKYKTSTHFDGTTQNPQWLGKAA